MSEQIDWSKAPEGAMVLLKHVRDDSCAWAVSHSEDARAWHKWNIKCSFHLMASMWSVVAERQSTPSWPGEGLPPVGVVCEMHYCGEWEKTEILCIGVKHVFIRQIAVTGEAFECSLNLSACQFRPIRTPEQIAADEREAAVNGMLCYDALGGSRRGLAEALYDAGYRKEQK